MKPKALLIGLGTVFVLGILVSLGSTDGYYVAASIGFFALCVVYAEGCHKL